MLFVIKNVRLHTMVRGADGHYQVIEQGYIVVEDKLIKEVGEGVCPENWTKQAEQIFDGVGCQLSPGFFDAHCHLGLDNEGLRWEGMDYNEMSSPTTPAVRAIDSIFAQDNAFAKAARAGVTTAFTGPGSANIVCGQFALISTFGGTIDRILIDETTALKCALGENPKGVYGQNKKMPYTRMGCAYVFREIFYRGQEYLAKRQAKDQTDFKFDFDLEPVADALERKIPLKIHAHRADDILTAVRLCEEFGVRYTLDHCTEGFFVIDALKEAYTSAKAQLEGVIVGPLFSTPSKPELARADSGRLVTTMFNSGIPTAIMTDHPVISLSLLPVYAAMTCRYGMAVEDALAAITAVPAQLTSQTGKRGRLEAGLEADIALFSGHPLAFDSRCLLTVSRGRIAWQDPTWSACVY